MNVLRFFTVHVRIPSHFFMIAGIKSKVHEYIIHVVLCCLSDYGYHLREGRHQGENSIISDG